MENIDRIEKYLNNELSKEERATFDKDCQNNQTLAEELAFYLQAHQAFKQSKIASFNQRYQASKANKSTLRRKRNRLYIGIAASAAIILLLVWFVTPIFESYQIKNQLAKHETPIFFLNEEITRSDDTSKNELANAFNAIEKEDYQSVIDLTDTLNNPSVLAMKAFAYFELRDYAKAADAYELYLENDIEYFEKIRAQWNLMLAYKQLNNKSAEQSVLQEMGKQGQKDILKAIKAQ